MNTYNITVSYTDDVFNISANSEEEAINKANKLLDEHPEQPEVQNLYVEVKK